MKRFKLSRLLVAISLAFISIAIPFSPKAAAVGEEYNWESDSRIIACKSGFDTCVVFDRQGGAVPGGQETFKVINGVKDFSFRGCKIDARGATIQVYPDGKSAFVTIEPFVTVGGNGPPAGYCGTSDTSKTMSETVTIGGTRTAVGNTQALNYNIRNATDTSPASIKVTIKAGKGQPATAPDIATQNSSKTTVLAVLKRYEYKGAFQLEPNKPYTLCADGFGCHDFDMPNQSYNLIIGEYRNDRTINVTIGSGFKGEVTVTILNGSGGTLLQTQKLNTVPTATTSAQTRAVFENIDPGKYQACAESGDGRKCADVTKEAQNPVEVSLDLVSAADGSDIAPELTCTAQFFNPISWFVCPIIVAAQGAVNALSKGVDGMLEIDTNSIFGGATPTSQGFYGAWKSFRNLGIGLILIAGLVMIISQAAGVPVLDAYTIRKVLPRLVVATIFITISWPVLDFLVKLSNEAGLGVRSLIYMPFKDIAKGGMSIDFVDQLSVAILGSAALFALGLLALLSFVITAFVSILIAFFLLFAREAVVMFLIIVSPFAIACSILPNTQKVYDMWKSTLVGMLLLFPIISGFIAVCRVFAVVFYNA